jgi:hypothetical protein
MAEDRAWMYNGWSRNGRHYDDWVAKTKDFVDHVFSLSLTDTVRCPCRRHKNNIFLNKERVSLDLCQFRFMPGYEVWEHHGEVVHRVHGCLQRTGATSNERECLISSQHSRYWFYN